MPDAPTPLWLPLALAQGLYVRARTPRLLPPPDTQGRIEAPPGSPARARPLRLLAVGDSIIAGIGCARQVEALTGQFAVQLARQRRRAIEWQALGVNGATADSALRLCPAPGTCRADVLLVSVGVNDAIRGRSPERFKAALRTLLEVLAGAAAPRASMVYAGMPPLEQFPTLPAWPLGRLLGQRAARIQAAARALAAEPAWRGRLHCHDFAGELPAPMFSADGFHPGPAGCAIWASGLADLLEP